MGMHFLAVATVHKWQPYLGMEFGFQKSPELLNLQIPYPISVHNHHDQADYFKPVGLLWMKMVAQHALTLLDWELPNAD